MRITIIGHGGGGKSTLARRLSGHFGVPRLEIDRLWFQHGGHDLFMRGNATESEKDVVRERISRDVKEFLSKHTDWVIDGTYTKTQPMIAEAADTLVYIKRPLYKRVHSHLFRIVKNENRHPETTKLGDILFTTTMVKRWAKGEYKKVEDFVANYKSKLVRLKSFKEINTYFDYLVEENKS